jgi:hypothetical protein
MKTNLKSPAKDLKTFKINIRLESLKTASKTHKNLKNGTIIFGIHTMITILGDHTNSLNYINYKRTSTTRINPL